MQVCACMRVCITCVRAGPMDASHVTLACAALATATADADDDRRVGQLSRRCFSVCRRRAQAPSASAACAAESCSAAMSATARRPPAAPPCRIRPLFLHELVSCVHLVVLEQQQQLMKTASHFLGMLCSSMCRGICPAGAARRARRGIAVARDAGAMPAVNRPAEHR